LDWFPAGDQGLLSIIQNLFFAFSPYFAALIWSLIKNFEKDIASEHGFDKLRAPRRQ